MAPKHDTGIILHCTVLHCTALHCTVLYCTAIHCTLLHITALHCISQNCTALYFTQKCAAFCSWKNSPVLRACQRKVRKHSCQLKLFRIFQLYKLCKFNENPSWACIRTGDVVQQNVGSNQLKLALQTPLKLFESVILLLKTKNKQKQMLLNGQS